MILFHWATGYFAPEYWATGYWQYEETAAVVTPVGISEADWWQQLFPEPGRVVVAEDDDELVLLMCAAKVIKDRRHG